MKTVSKLFRPLRIALLWPFDRVFFGGVGVLWRSREEWRAIFRDCLANGKPLPNIPLYVTNGQYTGFQLTVRFYSDFDEDDDYRFYRKTKGSYDTGVRSDGDGFRISKGVDDILGF